jgi:hypothetical protein
MDEDQIAVLGLGQGSPGGVVELEGMGFAPPHPSYRSAPGREIEKGKAPYQHPVSVGAGKDPPFQDPWVS